MNKVLSIHQPNYIPYSGYFYKIAKSDVFVYLDNVQYPRGQSYAARNKIKTPNGETFLTIPVSIPKEHKGKVKYTEVKFADNKWKNKHLKTIQLSYKRADYFNEVYELIEKELKMHESFVDLNIGLIESFAGYLEINTERIRLSELLEDFGQKTNLIIDICTKLHATHYLSGTGGGKEYNDEVLLNNNNIKLIYSDFNNPVYSQLWGNFISHLSIIDLLFNYGPKSRKILLGE
jgi:hypothetical protein